jgi:hypothetical protein
MTGELGAALTALASGQVVFARRRIGAGEDNPASQ